MKIYLAGSCSSDDRTQMMRIAHVLREHGHDIYCPFELKIENAWDLSQEDWAKAVFDADIKHLQSSEVMIMISPGRISTAGTNWEQGFAFAHKIPIIVIQRNPMPTSLMTYCGADWFFNADPEHNIIQIVSDIAERLAKNGINGMPETKNNCGTVLT